LFANNLQTELVNDSGKNGVQSIDIAQVFSATARGIDYPLLADNHEQLLGLVRRDLISLEELNQRAENRTNVLHLAINLAGAVAVGDRNLNLSLTKTPSARKSLKLATLVVNVARL